MLYITYVCPNEGMKLGDDDADSLFICRNTALVCKLHYYSLFFVCNISIISPSNYSFISFRAHISYLARQSVILEKHFSFSGGLVEVCRQIPRLKPHRTSVFSPNTSEVRVISWTWSWLLHSWGRTTKRKINICK